MKPIPLLWLILFSNILLSADVDLQDKLPEDFNWSAYFSEGDQSVSGEMVAAQAATAVLKRRIDELCAQYRALMTKRGDAEAVKQFDTMQELWQKFAEA